MSRRALSGDVTCWSFMPTAIHRAWCFHRTLRFESQSRALMRPELEAEQQIAGVERQSPFCWDWVQGTQAHGSSCRNCICVGRATLSWTLSRVRVSYNAGIRWSGHTSTEVLLTFRVGHCVRVARCAIQSKVRSNEAASAARAAFWSGSGERHGVEESLRDGRSLKAHFIGPQLAHIISSTVALRVMRD